MNFSAFSIRNPIPAVLLFVLLTLAGVISFQKSEVQDFPDIELPVVTVDASLPGAAPAQLETEVSRKSKIRSLRARRRTSIRASSTARSRERRIRLEKDPSDAVNEVRDAIGWPAPTPPSDMRDPPSAGQHGRTAVLAFTVA
jgi:multidrug efflux pump subunit AcrB